MKIVLDEIFKILILEASSCQECFGSGCDRYAEKISKARCGVAYWLKLVVPDEEMNGDVVNEGAGDLEEV